MSLQDLILKENYLVQCQIAAARQQASSSSSNTTNSSAFRSSQSASKHPAGSSRNTEASMSLDATMASLQQQLAAAVASAAVATSADNNQQQLNNTTQQLLLAAHHHQQQQHYSQFARSSMQQQQQLAHTNGSSATQQLISDLDPQSLATLMNSGADNRWLTGSQTLSDLNRQTWANSSTTAQLLAAAAAAAATTSGNQTTNNIPNDTDEGGKSTANRANSSASGKNGTSSGGSSKSHNVISVNNLLSNGKVRSSENDLNTSMQNNQLSCKTTRDSKRLCLDKSQMSLDHSAQVRQQQEQHRQNTQQQQQSLLAHLLNLTGSNFGNNVASNLNGTQDDRSNSNALIGSLTNNIYNNNGVSSDFSSGSPAANNQLLAVSLANLLLMSASGQLQLPSNLQAQPRLSHLASNPVANIYSTNQPALAESMNLLTKLSQQNNISINRCQDPSTFMPYYQQQLLNLGNRNSNNAITGTNVQTLDRHHLATNGIKLEKTSHSGDLSSSDNNINANPPMTTLSSVNLPLLESLFSMNDEPDDETIESIAQKINSTSIEVASWFHLRREAEKDLCDPLNCSGSIGARSDSNVNPTLNLKDKQFGASMFDSSCISPRNMSHFTSGLLDENKAASDGYGNVDLAIASNLSNQNTPPTSMITTTTNSNAQVFKSHLPTVPSSTLLAKLNSVTSRPNAHILANELDQKMIDLLDAFYAINDNPEPAAIEMIARRINVVADAIANWFDEKRVKLNPNAGPRSPPAKKREGGRVVTFSEYQRSLLEAIFDENNYLHPQEYEELSELIQVPSRNIKIWFKNRRSKQRLSGRIATPCSVNNSD